jgi:hypothetical protein
LVLADAFELDANRPYRSSVSNGQYLSQIPIFITAAHHRPLRHNSEQVGREAFIALTRQARPGHLHYFVSDTIF